MNILYVIHQFYPEFNSGTEKFLLYLSSAFQRDGHFVQIVTYTFVDQQEGYRNDRNLLVREYYYKGLPVIALKHQALPNNIHYSCTDPDIYGFAYDLLQGEKQFDLVHITHPMRLAPFGRAALDLTIPYIITLTDYWLICPKFILQTDLSRLCTGAEGGHMCEKLCPEMPASVLKDRLADGMEMLSGAHAIVSPSNFLASLFKKEFSNLDISIIPHGMDHRYLKSNRRSYKRGDKIVFAYCGVLSPHKGAHILLKAFLDLNPKNGELKIYGSCFHETDYWRHLQETARNDSRIQFCGTYREEEVGEVLSNVDVVVVPSVWYENYPLVLHEALACNVPVIASNIGGMAEKIVDSVNGFTFQVADESDLGNKMKIVLDNPEILNELKKNMQGCFLPWVEEEAYMYERLYNMSLQGRKTGD
jgi:glycosyltransferase involved in cell wall biosynthesis